MRRKGEITEGEEEEGRRRLLQGLNVGKIVLLHGMSRGHKKVPTIILEAVASKDLWIWHAFFGMPGSHNDINVLV